MSKENKFIPDENQTTLSDDLYKAKHKENDKTNEEVIGESKNKIDYEEKLKEVDELKNKVNELTYNFTSLQKRLEEFMRANSQNKSNEKSHIINDKGEEIRTYTRTKTKFDRNSGQTIIYAEQLNERDRHRIRENQEYEKRSDYIFNVDKQPDLVYPVENNETGEERLVVAEVKSATSYKPPSESSLFKNKNSWIGAGIGSLFGGVGGVLAGAMLGKEIVSSNSKDTDYEVHGFTRQFLIENPVKSYSEFISRVIKINPHITIGTLETIKDSDDIDFLNEAILNIYDVVKNNEKSKYDIPYIKVNFENYKLSNNLRNIMKDRNLSQEQMADLMKISRSSIISILNNRGTSLENAFKISRILQVSIEEIFRFEEDEEIEE